MKKFQHDQFIARNKCFSMDYINKHSSKNLLISWFRKKTNIWDIWDLLPKYWRYYYYDFVKPIINPNNKRLRKAVPKQWMDTTGLIPLLNFEMVKIFYEEEYLKGHIDWSATKEHKAFAKWLEKCYEWITKIKQQLERERDDSYPPCSNLENMFKEIIDKDGKKMYKFVDDGIPYEVKYKDVLRLEKIIEETDTKFLTQIIKYRNFFWT